MKEFYALAIEEGGSYSIISHPDEDANMTFEDIEDARTARDKQDCPEAISIVKVQVVE